MRCVKQLTFSLQAMFALEQTSYQVAVVIQILKLRNDIHVKLAKKIVVAAYMSIAYHVAYIQIKWVCKSIIVIVGISLFWFVTSIDKVSLWFGSISKKFCQCRLTSDVLKSQTFQNYICACQYVIFSTFCFFFLDSQDIKLCSQKTMVELN